MSPSRSSALCTSCTSAPASGISKSAMLACHIPALHLQVVLCCFGLTHLATGGASISFALLGNSAPQLPEATKCVADALPCFKAQSKRCPLCVHHISLTHASHKLTLFAHVHTPCYSTSNIVINKKQTTTTCRRFANSMPRSRNSVVQSLGTLPAANCNMEGKEEEKECCLFKLKIKIADPRSDGKH